MRSYELSFQLFSLKSLNLANKGIDFFTLIAYNKYTDSNICEAVRASS